MLYCSNFFYSFSGGNNLPFMVVWRMRKLHFHSKECSRILLMVGFQNSAARVYTWCGFWYTEDLLWYALRISNAFEIWIVEWWLAKFLVLKWSTYYLHIVPLNLMSNSNLILRATTVSVDMFFVIIRKKQYVYFAEEKNQNITSKIIENFNLNLYKASF